LSLNSSQNLSKLFTDSLSTVISRVDYGDRICQGIALINKSLNVGTITPFVVAQVGFRSYWRFVVMDERGNWGIVTLCQSEGINRTLTEDFANRAKGNTTNASPLASILEIPNHFSEGVEGAQGSDCLTG
jgi:hypothetical protein